MPSTRSRSGSISVVCAAIQRDVVERVTKPIVAVLLYLVRSMEMPDEKCVASPTVLVSVVCGVLVLVSRC
jgi:hypothetical protein